MKVSRQSGGHAVHLCRGWRQLQVSGPRGGEIGEGSERKRHAGPSVGGDVQSVSVPAVDSKRSPRIRRVFASGGQLLVLA
ncbi:hypothetical protein NDU88_002499 [Pleurodeles waltl]|uniref:Uncharacterized protein n=1 Tax=Pleurodeles waltl TaxID=8319 RepID=A0AAV7LDY2_PLEWA|nr:hypothetical protein NDU88_002499 [Pleurodeles waltl]